VSGWFPIAGAFLVAVAVAVVIYFVIDSPDNGLRRIMGRHIDELDRELRFLLSKATGTQIAQVQVVLGVVALVMSVFATGFLILIPLIAIGPGFWLRRARAQRVEKIEQQLDGWLLMLANMLKATGSLGDAIRATADLVHGPIGEELDLVLKEIRLGATLDQALSGMAKRINSRIVTANMATLLVGRTTGGELPVLLEETAASLREMARLEGVVRTQTAQGKAQLLVLVVAPILILFAFRAVEPTFFDPLFSSVIGTAVMVSAAGLWIGALVWARKVLDVDL
jgi:tight adherence protein B